jgi:hypothetical protein
MKANTMNIATTLATNRTGRIILHVGCLVRRPHNAAWHYRGILRELHLFAPPVRALARAFILLGSLIGWLG